MPVKSPTISTARCPRSWNCRSLRSTTACPSVRSLPDGSMPSLARSGRPSLAAVDNFSARAPSGRTCAAPDVRTRSASSTFGTADTNGESPRPQGSAASHAPTRNGGTVGADRRLAIHVEAPGVRGAGAPDTGSWTRLHVGVGNRRAGEDSQQLAAHDVDAVQLTGDAERFRQSSRPTGEIAVRHRGATPFTRDVRSAYHLAGTQ